jgi:pimeloyl-ACP methyl ester carboxylesterase
LTVDWLWCTGIDSRWEDRTVEATLADDRVLEYQTFGDDGGFPVVVYPGTPATAGCAALVAHVAAAAGLRLVVVSRPGYGASSTSPPGLASVARDTLELLDVLGLDQAGVYGISGGGPFALALAAVAPHRVDRVVVCAGPGSYPVLGGLSPIEASASPERRPATMTARGASSASRQPTASVTLPA